MVGLFYTPPQQIYVTTSVGDRLTVSLYCSSMFRPHNSFLQEIRLQEVQGLYTP